MALPPRCFAAPLGALSWLAACAAPELPRVVQVTAGQRTRVVLDVVSSNRTFVLQNESSGPRDLVYGDKSVAAGTKVVDDAQLQQLLDVLAAKGMFAQAADKPAPDARDVLAVEHGGRTWCWSRRLAGQAAAELPFHEAKAYFLTAYNAAVAYRADRAHDQSQLQEWRKDGQKSAADKSPPQGPPK